MALHCECSSYCGYWKIYKVATKIYLWYTVYLAITKSPKLTVCSSSAFIMSYNSNVLLLNIL